MKIMFRENGTQPWFLLELKQGVSERTVQHILTGDPKRAVPRLIIASHQVNQVAQRQKDKALQHSSFVIDGSIVLKTA